MFLQLDGDTELARAVDVMMARAKRIYILIINVNKLFSFSSSRCFLKEIENMFSVFLLRYKQLLDEVFVISRIIEVKVGVTETLPRPRLFWISQKPNLIIVLLYIERKKIKAMFLVLH